MIASKGRPPRFVPLNAKAAAVLTELCAEVESWYLFIYTKSSNVMKNYKGSRVKDFGKRWRNCLARAGINSQDGSREDNFHFHDLRREFATELIRNNVNPSVVQKLFAHSAMDITGVCIEADQTLLIDAVRSLDDQVLETKGLN